MFDTGKMSAPLPSALRGGLPRAIGGRSVHPRLRPLYPEGLRPGVHELRGALSIGLAMLAGSDWSAVVGMPDIGIEAALEWDINLAKMIMVPDPGRDWLGVVSELIEISDTVFVAPARRIPDAAAQRLAARLRHRNAALVVVGAWVSGSGEWSRAQSRVHAQIDGWVGLGVGHGQLSAQRLVVEVVERHQTRRHQLVRSVNTS